MKTQHTGGSPRLRIRTGRRADRLRRMASVLLLWAAGSGCAQASEATCTNMSASELGRLPSAFKISADAPIGTVLWSKRAINVIARCSKIVHAPGAAGVEATLYRLTDDPRLTANGLALYVTHNGNRGHGAASFPMGTTIKPVGFTIVNATVDIELVKIGPTPSVPTPLSPQPVPTLLIGGSNHTAGSDAARYLTHGFDGIAFQPTTCSTTTSAVFVDLGPQALGKSSGLGSGVGSTSSSKRFTIGVACDTGVAGAYAVHLMLEGAVLNASNGVLALSSSSTAFGVGIQLLMSDGQPVPLGTPWRIADSPASSLNLQVPLSARYYQVGPAPGPGIANGSATFTIIYR
ncbi:fimbrial protein [Burkholderia metallica]|uniref:fimbrial protein n=1 Tax=Burkholderia metallica TaxID=488729 RepID=UPI0015761916|nr:fimbrial protein [Burkholderia metallica]